MSLLTVQRSPTPSDSSEKGDYVAELEPPGDSDANKSSNASASEDFIAVTGAAVALPSNARRQSMQEPPAFLRSHMHRIFNKLRGDDCLKLVVKLESLGDLPTDYDRYFCLVACMGKQGTEESVILGFDLTPTTTSIGLVIPVMLDMKVNLHGEGGFKVIVKRDHDFLFKPISVQALWATLQALSLAQKIAHDNNYFANGLSHTWVTYYSTKDIISTRLQINEWRRTEDSDEESRGYVPPQFPEEIGDRRRLENEIRTKLREVMLKEDLEVATVAQLRKRLGEVMDIDLLPFKNFIGESVIFIFGQLESPSQIFDHVYLGSKWNACNLEELKELGIGYIINITKEIDNFYPDVFTYYNVPLYDVEQSDLMSYWKGTHKFINRARDNGSRVLVHCKMGMSRSASTVMAYAMKEFNWNFEKAYEVVKERRSCVLPNPGFLAQLKTYEGILSAKSHRQKFNASEAVAAAGLEPGSTTRRCLQRPSPTLQPHSETEDEELDQPINIEEDILLYKPKPLINDWKELNSVSGSAETSGDSLAPSNPSIAPDPMQEAPLESGACGGLVLEDPRTRDMRNVRDDLIIKKDPTEAPWRRSLRGKKSSADEADEERMVTETRTSEVIEISIEEPSGAITSNANFRPDSFWIKERTDSLDAHDANMDTEVAFSQPNISLTGDIPGEESCTDFEPQPVVVGAVDISSDDDADDVVMRDHDDLNSSLPPSGTVKRQSDRLEGLCEATAAGGGPQPSPASLCESAAVATPSDPLLPLYRLEDIQLEPGIVRKTRESIEARQRTSGEYSGAHSPTPLRVSSGENSTTRHFSGGGLSPVSATPLPAAATSPHAGTTTPSPPPMMIPPPSSSQAPPQPPQQPPQQPPPPVPIESGADPELMPPQVHQKMLLLIRQIGFIRSSQRGSADVQSVVREVESSVDRDPILPVRHLVEVFRGAC